MFGFRIVSKGITRFTVCEPGVTRIGPQLLAERSYNAFGPMRQLALWRRAEKRRQLTRLRLDPEPSTRDFLRWQGVEG